MSSPQASRCSVFSFGFLVLPDTTSSLDRADEAVTLSDRYYDGCLMDRNRYLVDAAGWLLAVYDGTRGGTAATIAYARRLGRGIIIVDPVARVIRNPVRE